MRQEHLMHPSLSSAWARRFIDHVLCTFLDKCTPASSFLTGMLKCARDRLQHEESELCYI